MNAFKSDFCLTLGKLSKGKVNIFRRNFSNTSSIIKLIHFCGKKAQGCVEFCKKFTWVCEIEWIRRHPILQSVINFRIRHILVGNKVCGGKSLNRLKSKWFTQSAVCETYDGFHLWLGQIREIKSSHVRDWVPWIWPIKQHLDQPKSLGPEWRKFTIVRVKSPRLSLTHKLDYCMQLVHS